MFDLVFPVTGDTLPSDHGYGLYAALCNWNSDFHSMDKVSVQTITGIKDYQGKIALGDKSCLRIRALQQQIALFQQLSRQTLKIGIHNISLGSPAIYSLAPVSQLKARIATIKGYQQPQDFLLAASRQLDNLSIQAEVIIGERKSIKIKRFTVIGFEMTINKLNQTDSITLQSVGLGGKRKMGCGVFFANCKDL
jgi:hypothetical protein